MCQLERAKCSFVLSLGISTIICSAIYFSTRLPEELKPLEHKECRPFSSECRVFLPSTEEGLDWHRRDCQVCRDIRSYREEVLHQSEISGYYKIYSAACVMPYKILIINAK